MELTMLPFIIVGLVIVFTYLWKTSHVFRYYMKVWYYHGNALVTALVVLPFLFMRPRNPSNIWPVQQWWNFSFKLIGVEVEKRNTEQLENLKEPAILIVNHQSSFDFIGIMQVSPYRATYLSKKELLYIFPFGIGAWLCGVIMIDRLNHEKAKTTMANTAKKVTEDNIKLWIFPEGTRNYQGDMLPFKKGGFHLAVQAQVPIYPVVQSSYKTFWDPKRKILNPGKIITSVLPPVQTKGLTAADVTELTEKVHTSMVEEFRNINKDVESEAMAHGKSLLVN